MLAGKKKAESFTLPDTALKDIQETDPILRQDLLTLKQIERDASSGSSRRAIRRPIST